MKIGEPITWGKQLRRLRPKIHVLCFLLCLFVVVAMLMNCRRQRAHAGGEFTERSESGPDLLFEEWIRQGEPEHALGGQLLLDVSTSRESGNIAKLRIVFPDATETVWTDLPVGTRKILNFEGGEFMVDILDIDSYQYSAKISIVRKRR